jgi:WD40 repeat protein
MSERRIFLNALDQESAAARTAYLDEACAGRPGLRRRVERLLRSHEAISTFLDVPAMEQLEAANQSLAFLEPGIEPNSLGRLDYYEVLEVIGRGSTGMVLRAKDTKLQRTVAIKVLALPLAASARSRQRFIHEAQTAAAVRDDHVVAIHAVSDEGPVPYLVMEYIHGITLEQWIHRAGALDINDILRIGLQTAQGLAAAHAQGLIHRDIKPANILLEDGVHRVKITDFGLAGAAAEASSVEAGMIAGTPPYMSPEQASGQPTDQRSDLFSLGSVLYALCTGRPPFEDESTSAILQRVREDTPRPVQEINPAIPIWLGNLIARLQAGKPAGRPESAQEVADLLSRRLTELQGSAAAEAVAPAPRPEVDRLTVRPIGHARWDWCLAGLLVALVALVICLALVRHHSPDDTGSLRIGAFLPLDLRRENIPHRLLVLAGGGDPNRAPPELAAVLGDGRFLLPHAGQIAWMVQSPDSKILAVPLDEDVVLYDATTGAYQQTLNGPGGRAFQVAFSPDNRLLAVTTRHETPGGAVRVWSLPEARVLSTNSLPGSKISCAVVFSPDSQRLLTEGDQQLCIFDALSGQPLQKLDLGQGIGSLEFSPDGKRLALTNWLGQEVKIFHWMDNRFTEARTLRGHRSPTSAATFSPDGQFLVSSDFTSFKIWNAQTFAEIATVEAPAQQLAFAPDGRSLLTASTIADPRPAYKFTWWDVRTHKELKSFRVTAATEPVRTFHFLSRDGKTLFVAPQHEATYIKAIDANSGKEQFPRQGHIAPLHVVAIGPDGCIAASAGRDWAVKLWDLRTGRVLHSLNAHTGAVCGLAFSSDGKLLASGSRDGTIAIWEVASGNEIRALHGHSRSTSRIQFGPDGRTIAAGVEGGLVKLWDVSTGNVTRVLSGHTGAVHCVAFSADGKRLASGGEDHVVLLHDLAHGGAKKLVITSKVNDLAFVPSGNALAAVCDGPESTVRLWNLESLQETTFRGHSGPIHGLAFSSSEPLLATCGDDGTVRLWNLADQVHRPRTIGPGPFGGPVRSVAFTPDGRYLATANANGMVYLLRMENSGRINEPEATARPRDSLDMVRD